MRKGLVIIDVQNDYFPGGAMELSGMTEAALQTPFAQVRGTKDVLA